METEEQEVKFSDDEKFKQQELKTTSNRKKQLKAMGVVGLRELVVSIGLEPGSETSMIERMLNHEAKARAQQRDHEAKMQAMVVQKKESAMSAAELKDLRSAKGIRRVLSHSVRIEQGSKKLKQKNLAMRKAELLHMDQVALGKLGERCGVKVFVKQVMVECLLREAMFMVELKKALTKLKKDDWFDAILSVKVFEEKIISRKAELKAMGKNELKKLLSSKGLEGTGSTDDQAEAFLADEVKACEKLKAYKAKVEHVLAKRREELKAKTLAELKDICTNRGLKVGVAKGVMLVQRILESIRCEGDVEKVLYTLAQNNSRKKLFAMESAKLKELCDQASLDALVKKLMVERLLAHLA